MQSWVNRKSYSNSLLVTMEHELESLAENIKIEENSLLALNNSLQAIKHIVESTSTSEELINSFKEFYLEFKSKSKESKRMINCNNIDYYLYSNNRSDYFYLGWLLAEDFKIATMLLNMLSSILSKQSRGVDFANNPLHMFDTIANYREFLLKILEDSVTSFAGEEGDGLFGYSRLQEKEFEHGKKTVDAYLTILLQNTLYHHIRQYISVKWNPLEQQNLTEFFDKWINLMPLRLYIHILVSYIEPKLKLEVNKIGIINIWQNSFYSWMSPWIKIFDQISSQHNLKICDSLKVTIRLKLIQILKDWHPSNGEVTCEIQKWKTVYDENSWNSLLTQSIIPKLAHNLKQLKINPQNQQIEPLNWVLRWTSHITSDTFALLFVQNFLPNWLQTLKVWLDNPNADFSEIMEWYQGWKSMFPSKIIQHESIQKFLNGALVLINSKI